MTLTFSHFSLQGPIHAFEEADRRAFTPAQYWLQEWSEYWVEAPSATHIRVGQTTVPPIYPGSGTFRLRFMNAVGRTSLQASVEGRPLGLPVPFEVLSSKAPTPEAHLTFLKALTADLTTQSATAPFAPQGPTSFLSGRTAAPSSPLFLLHYFTHHHRALTDACAHVLARPHEALREDTLLQPLAFTREFTSTILLDVLHHPERWQFAPHLPGAQALNGYAPATLMQPQVERTLNTPENQFVLAFLQELTHAADRVKGQAWWATLPIERQRLVLDVHSVARRTAQHLERAGVTALHARPSASRVLQRREGYAQLRTLWEEFRHAHAPFLEGAQRALDARNIAALYESWTFFHLARAIATALGCPAALHLPVTSSGNLARHAKALFAGHGYLEYNSTPPSTSVTYRPDLVWFVGKAPVAVFDAKFRVSPDASGRFVEDDITKMHAYRDALRLRSAVILYPGTLARFYPASRASSRTPPLSGLLGTFEGVGALPLLPGHT